MPNFVPCRLQIRLDCSLLERLNCCLLRLRSDVAVAFEHLTADVPGERLNGLLAHVWILRETRDKRVPHVVRPVASFSGFAGKPEGAGAAGFAVYRIADSQAGIRIEGDAMSSTLLVESLDTSGFENGSTDLVRPAPPAGSAALPSTVQPASAATTTPPMDFITAYADYADVFEIPRKAHEWGAIQMISSCLNGRVLIPNGGQVLTLDLWVLLLSASGMGRNTVLGAALDVVDQSGIQGLIRNAAWGSGPAFYQQLAQFPLGLFVWPEWSVVAKTLNDQRFGGVKEWLTDRYDNLRKPESIVYRQTGKKTDTPSIYFPKAPRTNILTSSSEDWFVGNLGQADVTGGFIPRFDLVHLPRSNRLIPKPQVPDTKRIGPLVQQLQAISQLQGDAQFTPQADKLYDQWYRDASGRFNGQPNPVLALPFFNRLRGQVLKLSVIFEASQSCSINVSDPAMVRAIDAAVEIERTIFEILPTSMSREGSEVEKMAELIRNAGSAGRLHSKLTLAYKHWKSREREERLRTLTDSRTIRCFERQTRGRTAKVYVHRDHVKAHKKKHPRDVPRD